MLLSSTTATRNSGSVNRDQDKKMLQWRRPAMIVGTPGRLLEHFESSFQFQTLFDGLGLLVLDEFDRLVEVGYLNPHHTRRTMFFVSSPRCGGESPFRDCGGYTRWEQHLDGCRGTGAALRRVEFPALKWITAANGGAVAFHG